MSAYLSAYKYLPAVVMERFVKILVHKHLIAVTQDSYTEANFQISGVRDRDRPGTALKFRYFLARLAEGDSPKAVLYSMANLPKCEKP